MLLIAKVFQFLGFLSMMIGASSMDSDSLFYPMCFILIGGLVLLTGTFVRGLYEKN